MAFPDPWNLTTPSDTDWASEGDDRIREMKRALDERLGSLIDNWPDGALAVKTAAIPAGATDGVLAIGLKSAIPNPPATKFYYATDTKELFVNVSNVWTLAGAAGGGGGGSGTPSPERFEVAVASYDQSLGAGLMSTGQYTQYRALGVFFDGQATDGNVSLVLSELGMTATNFFGGIACPRGSWAYYCTMGLVVQNGNPAEDYVRINVNKHIDNGSYTGAVSLFCILFVRV
ncbi:MAG TPA: hypothetical protein VIY48_07450 [Candidatus Paceibacterota bacterium]